MAKLPAVHDAHAFTGGAEAQTEEESTQHPLQVLAEDRGVFLSTPSSIEFVRTREEVTAEGFSIRRSRPDLTSCPQLAGGKEVYPTHWGITRRQLKDILKEVMLSPDMQKWDVYQFVNEWIKPRTAGKGMGFSLLLNEGDPQEVNVMVSHAWRENTVEFLKAVVRSTTNEDVMFICAFSIYQNEDDKGPSILEQIGYEEDHNPFKRVLDNIKKRGNQSILNSVTHRYLEYIAAVPQVLALLTFLLFYVSGWHGGCLSSLRYCYVKEDNEFMFWSSPNVWSWRPLESGYKAAMYCSMASAVLSAVSYVVVREVLFKQRAGYRGRMLVVPNENIDIYTRLWCVYEIFVASDLGIPVRQAKTLAPLGMAPSRDAECSNVGDQERILSKMHLCWGEQVWQKVDDAIWWIAVSSAWECFLILLRWGAVILLLGVGRFHVVRASGFCGASSVGLAIGIVVVICLILAILYRVADAVNGAVSVRRCLATCFSFLAVAVSVNLLWLAIWRSLGESASVCDHGGFAAFVEGFVNIFFSGFYSASFLVGLFTLYSRLHPNRFAIGWKEWFAILAMQVLWVVICTPTEQWLEWDLAWPEALYTILSASALVLCPLYALWTFSTGWGIAVVSAPTHKVSRVAASPASMATCSEAEPFPPEPLGLLKGPGADP